ncbi:PAS domain-containing sensor histidine kinase [Bradyrhizobium sp. WBAH42]|nr:hybrid sensor histidine kinase/response regulator [Bradyrhizobium sp. WBAH30]MDD1542128.1 hybrid sensor histidine kinase/response regulator [Bradyrhizobium sp. WBAH41]MDD1556280.1 hybrid sensor histidine kinase/response regulator [Bradyrhizobium sp. WBAH23]MDD1561879.1 hybrid sensor histidine kinase/response regulator [Bradyrhizobium sp. WBAH33]MDD1589100.1 hybrid sensor histidine kinase/response regulator [Bradyrhizobium sp. WBAH42]NRB87597.1 hybrid sensor histidine kinase/response regulat
MMWAFFERLLDSSMLSPHGICLLWEPELIWLHVVSDACIAAAYFSIPFALAILVTKRRDLKFGWVFWAFAIFIMACGLTHVLSIYTLWVPVYGIEGMVKAATAVASVFTAAALWPLLPKILTIPSPFELRQVQAALEEEEIKSRDAALLLQQVRDAQRAMRESVARLTAIVETAVDGVILFDAQDRILLFNPACERLFGYRADEVMNRNVGMLMPEADAARHFAIGGEAIGLRKDGTTFAMDLSVGQARQDGELIFVGIVHDLTGRKLTEQQLQQAQKMEMVGQLSGGIAHDFNNLLTVIIGNAEHLSEQLKARPDLKRFAEDICQSGEQGAELTQRLLAFSRRQLLRPQTIDCRSLLDSMFKLLKRTLREDIEIRTSSGPGTVLAFADRAQLESAVLNLALNAQDAMPSGGHLTLATELVTIDDDRALHPEVAPGSYALISVTDDGEGMTPEITARAFEPFFTTKEVGKGSGLGLSMVYGFAKQSGGHVSIYSEAGLGTTVRIYLPRANTGGSQADLPDGEDTAPRGYETILIVEDDPFVRSSVIRRVEALGYRVVAAVNGKDALQQLQGDPGIDLLFTDIVMPGGMSGWDLADQARRLRPGLPVLFTSGYALETLVAQGHARPQSIVLTKPYRKVELAQRLRDALAAAVVPS